MDRKLPHTNRRRKTLAIHDERIVRSTIGRVTVEHTESWCDFIINGHKVHFSPTEALVLRELVESYGQPLEIAELQQRLGSGLHEMHLTARHVRHLRAKLAPHGFHVLDMRDYGAYLLLYYA